MTVTPARLAGVALALALSIAPRPARAAIPWETKIDRASAAARELDQPILIEFWAVACEGCKEMDRGVYSDERVASAMAKVRPVKVDIDRDRVTARKYDVVATPTIVVTDSYGRELFRCLGALPVERMLELLEALPANVGPINRLSAALSANKDDFATLSGLGRELRAAGFYQTSSDYYERALTTREGRRPGGARTAILIGLARNALELRRFVAAARLAEQALGERDDPDVGVDLGRALLGQGKTEEARRVLGAIVARHPGTAAAAEAARLLAGR